MTEKFLSEYSKFLDDSKEHLSFESVSTYINFTKNLSRKELKFIESHISLCKECSAKFNEVFDEDLEFDEAKKTLTISENIPAARGTSLNEDYKRFAVEENSIEFILKRDKDSKIYLLFPKADNELLKSKIKLSSAEAGVLSRIVTLETGKRYNLPANIDLPSLSNIVLEYLYAPMQREKSADRKIIPYYWYAAAASVIILFGAALYFLFTPEETKQIASDGEKAIYNDSIKTSEDESLVLQKDTFLSEDKNPADLLAENYNRIAYSENRTLENFINRNIRSGSRVEIISPKISDTIKTHLNFKWSSLEGVNEYTIEVVDNKNRLVWEKLVDYNEVTFLDKLEPGLYYWKINAERRLAAVGKFFIK